MIRIWPHRNKNDSRPSDPPSSPESHPRSQRFKKGGSLDSRYSTASNTNLNAYFAQQAGLFAAPAWAGEGFAATNQPTNNKGEVPRDLFGFIG